MELPNECARTGAALAPRLPVGLVKNRQSVEERNRLLDVARFRQPNFAELRVAPEGLAYLGSGRMLQRRPTIVRHLLERSDMARLHRLDLTGKPARDGCIAKG